MSIEDRGVRLLGSSTEIIDLREVATDEPLVVEPVPAPHPNRLASALRRRARHVAAALLGAGMLVIPLGGAAIVALIAPDIVGPPPAPLAALWWIAVFLLSAAAAWGADHLARRYMPLVGLFRLSLVFPADVGSRLGLALRAGTVRDLDRGVIDVREGKVIDDADAAATIVAYAAALQKHSRFTRGHCERVRAYSELIAAELGIPKADRDLLRWAALLHDIGKLHVPAELLDKPGALDDDEWRHMRGHAEAGLCLAEPMRAWLGEWVDAVGQHHERYDGTGYPLGLKGDAISLAGRIVTVADSYETMTASRPYKKPMPQREARAELVAQAGKQFDPVVVRAMLNLSVRRLRWAAGPIAGLGDALVVALITQMESAGAMAGIGPTVGSWAPTISAMTPLRVGAVAAAVAAASVAPSFDAAPPAVERPPAVVTPTTAGPPAAMTYRASGGDFSILDLFGTIGGAPNPHGFTPPGHGAAGANSQGRALGAANGTGTSPSNNVTTPTPQLPTTAQSPVLTAPATPAIPHVSPAIPAAPQVPAGSTTTSVKPENGRGKD
jgi:putative nucleotidyltransferase with HDIG domain